MAGIFGYSREAVRVKVKKCEANCITELRKFSVDPQITSLEVLYSILAKAFDLKADFAINYKTIDPNGREIYLAVLSDWDLDAAFLRAHNLSIATSSEPCLNLKIDIKPFSETSDWESANNVTTSRDISQFQQSLGAGQKYVQNMQNRLPGLIMNQMEKTLSMVTKALNLVDDQNILQPPRPPLSDNEFRSFLDSVGQIVQPLQLRNVIYAGGIDPSLRRVVWKHILNVYPNSMTGRERMDYMKRKSMEYYRLRDVWRSVVQKGNIFGELAYVTSMVRKDVLRTDRLHPFYAGSDDNQNIASLFNILTTYALNHPTVSYCQGMSDIASPLLVTMGDEAQAYICFCAVMARLKSNFMLDGIAMTKKFAHLSEALQHYDPEFYEYLKCQQADDLLFCYRWLLLEMKREFAFDDSLRMLEVLWSALPAEPPTKELSLFEKEFLPPPQCDEPPPKSPPIVMLAPRENVYTKLCELRRQSSAQSLLASSSSPHGKPTPTNSLDGTKRLNHSLDEAMLRHQSSTTDRCYGDNKPFSFNGSLTLCKHQKITLDCDMCDSNETDDDDNVINQIDKQVECKDVSDLNGISLLRSKSVPLSCTDTKSSSTIDDRELKRNTVHGSSSSGGATYNNNHKIEHKTIFSKHHHRKGHFNDLKERIVASKKEYPPIHDNYSRGGGVAEININSPNRNYPMANNFSEQHLQDLSNDMNQNQGLNDGAPPAPNDASDGKQSTYSFFSIEYYQQFFNVDTEMVRERIVSSIIPKRAPATYLKQNIGTNPDLYGPFWIVVTLIFSIAISGNIASYLQHANANYHWRYNFHLVSIAATTIIMYICFVPLGLWASLKWFVQPTNPDVELDEVQYTPSLLTLVCLYGYSLVIYIPVSILWVIQISFLQWLLVISATFVSGSVLVLILSPALRVSQISLILASVIFAAHFLLATGFMLYFFHVPDDMLQAAAATVAKQVAVVGNQTG